MGPSPMGSTNVREAEIARIAESGEARAALERHLEEIIEGAAFKSSHRSALFLRHVVDRAIAGQFESLKERTIGMELFGRSPSYATGEDAIVRVTASDVRKRLQQHYSGSYNSSEFRISLPLGSYIPEITRESHEALAGLDVEDPYRATGSKPAEAPEPFDQGPASDAAQKPAAESVHPLGSLGDRSLHRWITVSILLSLWLLGTLIYGFIHMRTAHNGVAPSAMRPVAPASILPWSVLFNSPNPTHLVTSDPDLVEIQMITHDPIMVTDYANHNYITAQSKLSPQARDICLNLLIGDKAASVDTQVVAEISALAQSNSRSIKVTGARNMQFSNLKSDDNFILLGSPRSDPWVSLFDNQLDFQFVVDASGLESIKNLRPQPDEQVLYVPNSKRGATGQSFGIIAFLRNPDQNGQVLLLAGANASATQVAGKLVTDLPRLSAALRECGISSSGQIKHFEMLFRVNMMASSPSEYAVVACHILPENPAH